MWNWSLFWSLGVRYLKSLLVSWIVPCNTDEFSISRADTRESGQAANSITDISMSSCLTKTTFVGCVLFPSGPLPCPVVCFEILKNSDPPQNDLLKNECWSTHEKWKVPFSTQQNYFIAYCGLPEARFRGKPELAVS